MAHKAGPLPLRSHRRSPFGVNYLAALFGLPACATIVLAAPVQFDIPAQPAPAALHLFVRQSDAQVIYNLDELKGVKGNEVKGAMEPADALRKLLEGTGYEAKRASGENYVVTKAAARQGVGSVKGSLVWPTNEGAEGVSVFIHETGQSTVTDRYGQYVFASVPAGTYLLVARADGYQPMHIVDVRVAADQELTLGKEKMRKAEDVTQLEPYLVAAEEVTQLGKYEVSGTKPQPFSDANVDLPRGIDDAQPYFVYDRTTIEQSGATTVDDFIRSRVPMDVTERANGTQLIPGGAGGVGSANDQSSINIGGFGSEQTLILVDGHRLPNISAFGFQFTTSYQQPDVNGIPLAAIDRIEVLPASASAIYGASAVGGVINIILRQDYLGAELKFSYEDTYQGRSPIRQLSLNAGAALEHGRTHLLLTLSDTSSDPLTFADRQNVLVAYRDRAISNDPGLYGPAYGNTPLGSTPNFTADPVNQIVNGMAVETGSLFGPGTSDHAFIPVGYTGAGGLGPIEANAGSYNLQSPAVAQAGYSGPWFGLGYPLGVSTRITAADLNLRRQFLPKLELFIELSHSVNASQSGNTPGLINNLEVPASAPDNIFHTNVEVTAPTDPGTQPDHQKMTNNQVVVGFKLKLPAAWTSEGDYTYGQTASTFNGGAVDPLALQTDVQSGAFNVFQDLLATRPSFNAYNGTYVAGNKSLLASATVRAAGPVWNLPGGDLTAALGAGYQREASEDGFDDAVWLVPHFPLGFPIPITGSSNTYSGLAQTDDDGYGELDVPLFSKRNALPGLAQLDLQLAGRLDYYKVLLADPSQSDPRYVASNDTIGLRYRPIQDVLLRGSFSSAFQPPTYSEISPVLPDFSMFPTGFPPIPVIDPKRGGELNTTIGASFGGNPDLKPETSRDVNVGIVLEPRFLPGLHISVDYAHIQKHNDIEMLSAQGIVDNEDALPGRVVRGPVPPGDPFGVGPITFVNGTYINLFESRSENYTVAANYEWRSAHSGNWRLFSTMNCWEHYLVQLTAGQAPQEQINTSSSFTQQQSKFTGNGGINWSKGPWSAGWSARFYGDYRVYSAYIQTQGSPYVDNQIYHDVYIGYAFPTASMRSEWWTRALSGSSIQVGAKNVFNARPAYDASNVDEFYSFYGDIRMGSYYVSVKKEF
jgi:iron complex outermembrane recepter protein